MYGYNNGQAGDLSSMIWERRRKGTRSGDRRWTYIAAWQGWQGGRSHPGRLTLDVAPYTSRGAVPNLNAKSVP